MKWNHKTRLMHRAAKLKEYSIIQLYLSTAKNAWTSKTHPCAMVVLWVDVQFRTGGATLYTLEVYTNSPTRALYASIIIASKKNKGCSFTKKKNRSGPEGNADSY